MSRLAWGLLASGVLASGALLGFGLVLIRQAARDRRSAQQQLGQSRSIFEAGIQRQAERLRAELDDDAAVAAWLAGGKR